MLHINSYYKFLEDVFFVNSVKNLESHLIVQTINCSANASKSISSTDLEWSPFLKNSKIILRPFEQSNQWILLNDKCLKCIYYFHKNEKEDLIAIDFCRLRNDLFIGGCKEMYVDCPLFKEKEESSQSYVLLCQDPCLDKCKLLFKSRGYNNVLPISHFTLFAGKYNTLSPTEIKLIKKIFNHSIYGISYGMLEWLESGIANDDMSGWICRIDDLTEEKFYYYFYKGATDILFDSDGTIGLGWDELRNIYVVGDKEKVDYFCNSER